MKTESPKARTWAGCLGVLLTFSFIGLVHGQGIIVVQPNPQQSFTPFYPGEQDIPIDINGDGINDLIIRENDPNTGLNNVQMFGLNGNQIVADGSGNAVANMNPGDVVGPASNLTTNEIEYSLIAVVFGGGTSSEGGNFAYQTNGYIGFDLVSGGQNYYGWMQVANPGEDGLAGDAAIYATIPEYAYETSPNTPIVVGEVPEPSTWGLLALGGLFLVFRLRRQNQPQLYSATLPVSCPNVPTSSVKNRWPEPSPPNGQLVHRK